MRTLVLLLLLLPGCCAPRTTITLRMPNRPDLPEVAIQVEAAEVRR